MPHKTIELLDKGRQANIDNNRRKAGIVELPETGRLIISGDLHGHCRNFEKILAFANLAENEQTHVIFQEIIHGGPEDSHGGCLSFKLLLKAIEAKLEYPNQVHLVLGNHDTAFINNSSVLKNGKEMNVAMRQAMDECFGSECEQIKTKMAQFLFSQPLAVKCQNRIWISHSLPSPNYIDKFDTTIFSRQLRCNDIVRPGSAYLLTWGRRHNQNMLDQLAEALDVDIFIVGHQPQPQGWERAAENLFIIASDHNHGCIMELDLAKTYTPEQIPDCIITLASIS